ncbi:DUF1254 domain-containing protein [Streptomyces sp. NPDC008122]|uniref:DUF1254 domain-containing protein n=1 Tax=Streptomyces sp. NPDC008122 TaxID=3364810 RepID=UPI0036E4AADA
MDLSDGPVVIDVPRDCLTVADDMWFRWVTDLGVPGPDRGAGGRYLFVGPGYEGPLPEGGMFTHHMRTSRVWMLGRCFLEDDAPAPAVRRIKEELRITPYSPGGYGTSIASFLLGESGLAPLAEPRTPPVRRGQRNGDQHDPARGRLVLHAPRRGRPGGGGLGAGPRGGRADRRRRGRPREAVLPRPVLAGGPGRPAATANAYARAVAMRPRPEEGFTSTRGPARTGPRRCSPAGTPSRPRRRWSPGRA